MRYFISIVLVFLSACSNNVDNSALGTLERDRIAHVATSNEVVVALPVSQGAIVDKGTVLVKLDDTLQNARVTKAKAELTEVEASFEKLQSGARKEEIADARAILAGSKAKLVESEANYTRAKDLAKRDLASKATLDQSLAARDANIAVVKSAREKLLVLTNGAREEDLRIAEARIAVAKAVLASEVKKLANLTIVATRDGVLDSLPWNLGERVTSGSPVAVLLAGKAPFARVYVPEPYRVKMKVGDVLSIHIDGLEAVFKGRLRWIATEPAFTPYYALNQEERSRLMYLAEIQLPDEAAHLPNGVPAQVELPNE